MQLEDPLTAIPGIGQAYAAKLGRLGLFTIDDLLNHFPVRYLDYGHPSLVGQLELEKEQCFRVSLKSKALVRTRRGQKMLVASFHDASGKLNVVWFNQEYLISQLNEAEEYFLAGKPTLDKYGKKQLISPTVEPVIRGGKFTTGLVPVYPLTEGISSRYLQAKVDQVLTAGILPLEFLTRSQLTKADLVENPLAYRLVHQPEKEADWSSARRRLAFNDLLALRLKSELSKGRWSKKEAIKISADPQLWHSFKLSLPFELTGDQQTAIKQIQTDMVADKPMNRLLQGDVGSGKTVVAAAAMLAAVKAGKQAVLMAPTQVLAVQHHQTLSRLLEPFAIEPELVVSGRKAEAAPLLVGTHALLHRQKLIDRSQLALLVVDEQHRFGVEQRSKLLDAKIVPHILTMTATPIPRTIALTAFGHLDLSYLAEKPAGRQQIKTWLVPESKRNQALKWIKNEVDQQGSQVFVVCPFVEASEHDTLKNVKAATVEVDKLKKVFSPHKVRLLHGRLKSEDKEKQLADFAAGKFSILVTTPVVEVGVDIPGASIMVIEDAWKFGLAQLHQLRGRVGRNDRPAYCLLFPGTQDGGMTRRLRLLEQTEDGLKLAEEDLKLRGPGQVFGVAQSGYIDTSFAAYWNKQLKEQAQTIAKQLAAQPSKAEKILTLLNASLAKSEARN